MAQKVQVWDVPSSDEVGKGDEDSTGRMKMFLSHFGYLPSDADQGSEALNSALLRYQEIANIPKTGKFDEATATEMAKRRCGVPDRVDMANFTVASTRWEKFNLTYQFDTFCEDLTSDEVRTVISGAFRKWAAVAPFTFREVSANADIHIGWFRGDHADGSVFDGPPDAGRPGNVLAHAFFPPPNGGDLAGDVHFDEDDKWTVPLLENVALHEIGHSLGLEHSTIETSVMWCIANGVTELTDDDIQGIQSIYGHFGAIYHEGDPGNGIGDYDLKSTLDRAFGFDYDHSGKPDHLCLYRPGTGTFWILKNINGEFKSVFAQGDPGNGIGNFDLKSQGDRAFAFDYDHSGRLDHICLYRPGTGTFWILRNRKGEFESVYAEGSPGNGIGGFDLQSGADRAFAFDYDHSGMMDHIALYRPGTGTFWILKHGEGSNFTPVYAEGSPGNGIGGFDLQSGTDRAFAYDYDHSGMMDHIALYRPGTGTFWILKHGAENTFIAVYAQGSPGNGIGGYDLQSPADQAMALDSDKLVLYRPGKGAVFVLKNQGGEFEREYARGDPGDGIAGYDLKSGADQAFAFDYDSTGRENYLVFIRPGTGTIWIIKRV